MNWSKVRILFGSVVILASLLFVSVYTSGSFALDRQAIAFPQLFNRDTPDHLIDKYTTVVDESGEVISMMSRMTFVGDQLFTADGRSYRINRVDGERAEATFLGMDPQIVAYNEFYTNQVATVAANNAGQSNKSIAIYHTHSAESYVPTDGKDSIPFQGGIYQVGKTMAGKLQGKGVNVKYDETPHDPHDNNAYVRSRRTAAKLLEEKPAAIFDVHRDGVPDPAYYRATIDGQKVARLRLVVGRQNPRMDANMDFAKRMMAAANNMHNQVVKEIFVARGGYNQDLAPNALLIEAGTHTNTREEAATGVALFSEAVPTVLGLAGTGTPAAPGGATPAGSDGGAGRALAWILGLTAVGGLGFLLISSGSLENAKKRISGFGKEFTSFFGPRPAARKKEARKNTSSNREEFKDFDPLVNKTLEKAKDDLTKD